MEHINSYYHHSRNDSTEFPSLQISLQADVCIIGGGLTGLASAIDLQKKGYQVILIESNRIGWGASGRNGGQFLVGYSTELETLLQYAGKEQAQMLFDFTVESLSLVKKFVQEYNIECDLVEGSLTAAVKQSHIRDLEHMLETYEKYGFQGCKIIPKDQIHHHLGTDKYQALLHDPHSGHLHPLNFVLGLARVANSLGVQIYEQTIAQSYTKTAQGVTVKLEEGQIDAKFLILAGNAYLNNIEKKIEKKIIPVGTYIIGTEPLAKEQAEELIKNNDAVCDLNFVLDYYRLSADRRMLYGGKVNYSGLSPLDISKSLQKRMNYIFPQTQDVKIDFSWGGYVAITQNRAPHFGRLNESVYFAQGFSGHGVAMTLMAGQLLSEAISGQSEKLDIFQKIKHRTFPGGKLFRKPLLALGMCYYKLRDYL